MVVTRNKNPVLLNLVKKIMTKEPIGMILTNFKRKYEH